MATTQASATHDHHQSPIATQQAPQGQMHGPSQPEQVSDSSPPLHRYLGNGYMQAMTAKTQRPGLQTKLAVNEPGDIYEQEADRVADQVMAAPTHANVSSAPLQIQRFSGALQGQTDAAPASVDRVLASPGRPLDPAVRQDMEQRFGYEFSQVRVHTDSAATQSAQDVNANAYTVGHNIVFDAGRFTPGTTEGRRLIAHELTHVVQQSMTSRRLLMRNSHSRAPILEPGTGFDGIRQFYGMVFDRSLTADQVKAVKDYRAWMEAGFTSESGYAKGNWAREAGARAAAFPGNAPARASLYAEFQRQIVQATGSGSSDWVVSAERGADGSYIFRGNPLKEAERIFVVDPQGNCHAGLAKDGLQGRGPGKMVDYTKLRAFEAKTPTSGSATTPQVAMVEKGGQTPKASTSKTQPTPTTGTGGTSGTPSQPSGGGATPAAPGPSQRPQFDVLVVGAETEAEFAYARSVTRNGGRVIVANPTETAAATAYKHSGGDFFKGKIETLPPNARFNLIREDYPVPLAPVVAPTREFLESRLGRLQPGGTWVLITEKKDFAVTLAHVGKEANARFTVHQIPREHEATPKSDHPREREKDRYAITFIGRTAGTPSPALPSGGGPPPPASMSPPAKPPARSVSGEIAPPKGEPGIKGGGPLPKQPPLAPVPPPVRSVSGEGTTSGVANAPSTPPTGKAVPPKPTGGPPPDGGTSTGPPSRGPVQRPAGNRQGPQPPTFQPPPGAVATAAGSFAANAIAVPFINRALQEHYAEYRAEGARELTEQALAKANPQFLDAIKARRTKIEEAQAQGRLASLHVTVQLGYTDTTDRDAIAGAGLSIGDVAYVSNIVDVQVVLEGETPRRYDPDTWFIGDLVRGMVGVSFKYRTHTYPIQGTNLEVRHRNEVVKTVETAMGTPAAEFEGLVIRSEYGGLAADTLREYAAYRRELAMKPPYASVTQARAAEAYWTRMEALVTAPIDQKIVQAKIKSVPLAALRAHAIRMRDYAGRAQDIGGGSEPHAYWSDVLRLIDEPLDDRFAADRQRALWAKGPSQDQISRQQGVVASLNKRVADSEQLLARLSTMDARTQEERAAGEPPHPPWSRRLALMQEIKVLREELAVEKRLLSDFEKKR